MKIKPVGSQMLVKPLDGSDTSPGGIYIGAAAPEFQGEFDVLAVGHGTYNDKGEIVVPDVFPGCRILANRYAGVEVEQDGVKLRIMEATSAIAIIHKKAFSD